MIEGIDVYHEDGNIDWDAVRADGISFAISKATQGAKFKDSKFAANWTGIVSAGIPMRGTYHFFSMASDPSDQANHFATTVDAEGVKPGDFFVLDIEKDEGKTGDEIHDAARVWVEEILGRFPDQRIIMYTGRFWRDIIRSSDNLGCELWLAAYVAPDYDWAPARYVPQAWTEALLWQYTSDGSVSGIDRKVDRNRCRLTEKELAGWFRFELEDPFAGLPIKEPTLRKGTDGAAVERLQQALKDLGFDPGEIDGSFGLQTEEAVRDFQFSRGLDVDGIAGPDTWRAIHAEASITVL